jgi:hypothetical protein
MNAHSKGLVARTTSGSRGLSATSLLLACALAACAFAGAAFAQQTYKWVDDKGVVHYTDKLPSEQLTKGAAVLDKQAVTIRKIDPPLTPAQRAAKDEEDRRAALVAKAREESDRADRALMQSFSSEGEIMLSRNRALGTLDAQIQSAHAFVAQLTARKTELEAKKAALGNKPVPDAIERELESIDEELGKQAALIESRKADYAQTSARYDTFVVRWRDLKSQADAKAVPTTGAASTGKATATQ